MQVEAHAKINWTLRVTGRRDDGFHDLETVFQEISLHDTLTIEPSSAFSLTCSDPTIPTDERNLITRAFRLLAAPPVSIHLEKRIPSGGGLGGGSSDAAATLVALSSMFSLSAPLDRLALQLGSDVPFFLVGGTAYATGRGEVLTPLPSPGAIPLLLLFPRERVSTADAFRQLRGFSPPLGFAHYRALDVLDAPELINDFEPPIFAARPALAALRARLAAAGAAWAHMTGSGSTIVGAFRDVESRDAARVGFGDVRHVGAECVTRRPSPGASRHPLPMGEG
jgi:4-diphosphocytidyl-2-C-methyl-D-erythritol kinase